MKRNDANTLPNRVVRDYEKYLSRQFKRGTSRQELNVSWLKKNEIDLKRHVQELRDNITNNWTTTGQELSRELRQFWPVSRPQSPARFHREVSDPARSPTSINGPNSKEFVTGYALGLVGGVRSWVCSHLKQLQSPPASPSVKRRDGLNVLYRERALTFAQMTKNRRMVRDRNTSDDDSESDEQAGSSNDVGSSADGIISPTPKRP